MENCSKKERLIAITKALGTCFQSQKTYGQDPSKIKDLVVVFDYVLSDYSTNDIRQAFMTHLQNEKDFPTPACITSLLKPEETKISTAAYVNACKWLETNKDAPFTLEEQKFSKIKKEYEASQVQDVKPKQDWEALEGSENKALLASVKRMT